MFCDNVFNNVHCTINVKYNYTCTVMYKYYKLPCLVMIVFQIPSSDYHEVQTMLMEALKIRKRYMDLSNQVSNNGVSIMVSVFIV